MALNYTKPNGINAALFALMPTRSYAQEQALEDRKLQFLALQANQAEQEKQIAARSVAEYDSKVSQIQQLPFVGQDRIKLNKWLDGYQERIKERIKSTYNGDAVAFIETEGSFIASKLEKDLVGSTIFRDGKENLTNLGLILDAMKSGKNVVGQYDQDGKYIPGNIAANRFMSGQSEKIRYNGAYKVDGQKIAKYFADQAKPVTAEDLQFDEKGKVIGASTTSAYVGAKVPKEIAEQALLTELDGNREALEDFKSLNPGFLESLRYSNDYKKQLELNTFQREFDMKQGMYNMRVQANDRDAALDALRGQKLMKDINESDKNSPENIDSHPVFKTVQSEYILPTKGITRMLRGRTNTTGGSVKDLEDGNGIIRFEKYSNIRPTQLAGIERDEKTKSYRFTTGNKDIIVPGYGDLSLDPKAYRIVNFDENGLLKDKSGQAWVKGELVLSQEASKNVFKDGVVPSNFKRYKYTVPNTSGGDSDRKKNPRIEKIGYKVPFYSPYDLKYEDKVNIINSSGPQKSKLETSSQIEDVSNSSTDEFFSSF